jgi:hypothetical protein
MDSLEHGASLTQALSLGVNEYFLPHHYGIFVQKFADNFIRYTLYHVHRWHKYVATIARNKHWPTYIYKMFIPRKFWCG